MSIRRLPRQMGLVVICNGMSVSSDVSSCTCGENGQPARFFTGGTRADYTRKWLKDHEGWGRGLRLDHKRNDLCPYHFKLERFLVYQLQWRQAEDKAKRDEAKKAKLAASPPKKPRSKTTGASIPASSPSAASVPAPAT